MKSIKTQIKNIKSVEEIIEKIICDCCGKEEKGKNIEYSTSINNIKHSFGYGSKFDLEELDIDICDECLVDILLNFKNIPTFILNN